MPIVPSLGQVLAANAQQSHTQPSPNGSTASLSARRSPPTTSRISPVTGKLQTTTHMQRGGDHTPDRVGSPPPMLHTQSTPTVPQLSSQGPSAAHQPRPVATTNPPDFLKQETLADGDWHVTDELLAEIDYADQQGQLQGTSGVAYAGGAASNSSLHLQHKDHTVERARVTDRSSPKDSDGQSSAKRQTRDKERDVQNHRESPKTRERAQTVSSTMSHHNDPQTMAQRTPEYRGSPPFHTPMASPGERSAGYTQYIPDSYGSPQAVSQSQASRKPVPAPQADSTSMRSTPPSAKHASQSPPQQPLNSRVADRALPLQEEPEEDGGQDYTENEAEYDHRRSPPGEVYPDGKRYRDHGGVVQHSTDEDDEETLNEEVHEHPHNKSESDDSGFTPRSPSTNLPERPRDERYSPNSNGQYNISAPYAQMDNQKTVRVKHRSGSTDQLGIRSFDPALFEQTMNVLRNGQVASNGHRATSRSPPQTNAQPVQHMQSYPSAPPPHRPYAPQTRSYDQQASRSLPPMTMPMSPHMEDLQGVFDNPTSTYLQTFLQSPAPAPAGLSGRPNAPIPPTPLTAAPSPSPLSALPSDVEPRQIGSPYPYPFTHIRRTALSAAQNAPSSTYDPNHPAAVREQLAMQMHIYALNNGLTPPSESAFSPSSTPFPGTGYNPWAFLHQPAYPGDSTMSLRSSPSHEPVNLPMPPIRTQRFRRKENGLLRAATGRRRVNPPPRVESTQPRETSPEPSSGEETAGEERFVDRYSASSQNGAWMNGTNGHGSENGTTKEGTAEEEEDEDDWVDEDEDEDDLLQLEYHPSFISKPVKRRRRWEMRWDTLVQNVSALLSSLGEKV